MKIVLSESAATKLIGLLAASRMISGEGMRFVWDPDKRERNLEKHGIDFVLAADVFLDRQRLDEDSTRPEHGEVRRKAIGRVGQMMVSVIYTDRDDVRRIISARRARRDERERYRQSAETA